MAKTAGIDPRGPRFAAAVTTVVLALALLLGSRAGLLPLALQTLVFALGAFLGLQAHPYGWLYRRLVRPRLGPPKELEDEAPPRFAQAVGLLFAVVGLLGGLMNVSFLFYGATAMALAAAFLNAAFNICLGCELYLRMGKLINRSSSPASRQGTPPNRESAADSATG